MKKIIITYGIIAGLITGGLMLATMPLFVNGTINHDHGLWIGYTGMIIALSLVFFGVKSFRDNHEAGTITFGKAFIIGMAITMIASVFYVISWEITYARSGDWFMAQWSNGEIEKLKSGGASESEIQKAQADWTSFVELYKNPLVRAGMTLMEIFPVGIIVSLLSASLLRKKEFLQSNNN
jgi:Protein of unknown function (DUF4199)